MAPRRIVITLAVTFVAVFGVSLNTFAATEQRLRCSCTVEGQFTTEEFQNEPYESIPKEGIVGVTSSVLPATAKVTMPGIGWFKDNDIFDPNDMVQLYRQALDSDPNIDTQLSVGYIEIKNQSKKLYLFSSFKFPDASTFNEDWDIDFAQKGSGNVCMPAYIKEYIQDGKVISHQVGLKSMAVVFNCADVWEEVSPAQQSGSGTQTENKESGAMFSSGLKADIKGLDQVNASASELIGRLIKILMGVIGTVALVMFVYGGVMWMTASGNSDKEGKAMGTIVWSSLGIVVILASYALADLVFEAFR